MTVYVENGADYQAACLFARLMKLWTDLDVHTVTGPDGADITVRRDGALPAEGFSVSFLSGKVKIYGADTIGALYGLTECVKKYARGDTEDGVHCASPRLPFRGVQLYMPAKEHVEGFKRIIDMLAYMKINTVIIEVGGGMEYKKHPEINAAWEHFCRTMEAFPGGPTAFQGTAAYWRDSTHTELGGGSYLPQDVARGIVDYAKGYGMDVIPELQMMSHSYYITSAYPQYAERGGDQFPDTVCPKNEDAYRLYFDLAAEVIDVFKPATVSVGHDEIWTLRHCDACKQYAGHELLAYEINRLHGFYSEKGVKIAMWCEKLQSTVNYFTGETLGGGEVNAVNDFGHKWHIPDTTAAFGMIPKDILLLDWLYSWSWDSQDESQRNGFLEIFGNFHGEITRGWEKRLASPCVIGGETSSWCLSEEFTLGRDGIIGDFWYSAKMLWDKNFKEELHDQYLIEMAAELPMLRETLRGRPSASVSLNGARAAALYTGAAGGPYAMPRARLPERGVWRALKHDLPEILYGAPAGEAAPAFTVNHSFDKLLFIHTCLGSRPHRHSYYLNAADWAPVVYAVRYTDGVTVHAQARFGIELGNIGMDFGRKLGHRGITHEGHGGFGTTAGQCPDPPLYEYNMPWKDSLLYSAHPFEFGGGYAYIMEWENPRPDIAIEKVIAVNNVKTKDEQAVLFCVAGVVGR